VQGEIAPTKPCLYILPWKTGEKANNKQEIREIKRQVIKHDSDDGQVSA
jgi:hypothetical protein